MEPEITVLDRMRLHLAFVTVGGRPRLIRIGAWAFYVPALGIKILNSVDGTCHCTRPRAPRREEVLSGGPVELPEGSAYSLAEWKAAYAKPALRRAAENYVALTRLAVAGLGPRSTGLVVVRSFSAWFGRGPTVTAGYRVDNLDRYPEKPPSTAAEMLAAGVRPDRTESCLREQIRGYVSDLNSAVGVMPLDAEDEVSALVARMEAALG